jgi:hypothetical protein
MSSNQGGLSRGHADPRHWTTVCESRSGKKISYLDEISANLGGIHLEKKMEDVGPVQGVPVTRKPEPIDMAALRTSFLNSLTPLERGFSSREWIDSLYGVNWDKNMSSVTNVIVSLICYGDTVGCWKHVNTFFTEGSGLVPFHDAGGNKGFEADIAIGAFNFLDMQGFIAHLESLEWRRPMSFQIIYRTQDENNFLTINVLGKGWTD